MASLDIPSFDTALVTTDTIDTNATTSNNPLRETETKTELVPNTTVNSHNSSANSSTNNSANVSNSANANANANSHIEHMINMLNHALIHERTSEFNDIDTGDKTGIHQTPPTVPEWEVS